MKKLWILALVLALSLCLCACGELGSLFAREYKFPENTAILGVDVSEMDTETAWSQLEAAAGSYVLELTVDGVTVPIPGKDIGLSASKDDFIAAAEAMEAGTDADFSRVIRFNDGKLRILLKRSFNKACLDAAMVYDEAAGQFRLEPHSEGLESDPNAIAVEIKNAIRTLQPQHTLTGMAETLIPQYLTDDAAVQEALEAANKLLSVQLAYNFGADEASPIPADVLCSFVDLGADGFTPTVDLGAVEAYAAELAATYSIDAGTGSFQTTGGEQLDVCISYEGCYVDAAALAQDIATCMLEGISGERAVPYLGNSIQDMPYGGTYVEIDLTAQHLWYYKDGECLVSTDLVSGMVSANMNTPTGVFYIYSKSRSIYLEGDGYKSFVYYWMPFTGGYGMHDALWRDEFGGDIYLDDGSHGCVNLPLEAAQTLYQNAPVGTRVILYGGEGSTPAREQEIIGATEHSVADDAKPFKLKMRSRYAWPEFYYASDNPDVATVSEDGTVTVTGIGTANITVTATTEGRYASAQTTVAITVHSACDEGRHQMGPAVTVTRPTCQPGVEKSSCSECDYFEEEQLPAVADHSFDGGASCSVCGADNPNYTAPATQETSEKA